MCNFFSPVSLEIKALAVFCFFVFSYLYLFISLKEKKNHLEAYNFSLFLPQRTWISIFFLILQ